MLNLWGDIVGLRMEIMVINVKMIMDVMVVLLVSRWFCVLFYKDLFFVGILVGVVVRVMGCFFLVVVYMWIE